ncbi:sporulation initiation factor Spo0A C-terminal domain-containing protein [Clostridium neonatale]|uniref:sporulation initiation factor Spo0A C-terminal domain-containing protein n=1 Tax=Clostridium neonatale TaxID=137838 RepID=UPI0029373437|nr:sporulation initiation factor Spo0A C-terminal domain-containing protein [Clostridium neonatale]
MQLFKFNYTYRKKRCIFMFKFSKRDSKKLFKEIAHLHGVSISEVRKEMELVIESARNSPDPQKQAEFQKLFGDRTPTPEEFICVVSRKVKY